MFFENKFISFLTIFCLLNQRVACLGGMMKKMLMTMLIMAVVGAVVAAVVVGWKKYKEPIKREAKFIGRETPKLFSGTYAGASEQISEMKKEKAKATVEEKLDNTSIDKMKEKLSAADNELNEVSNQKRELYGDVNRGLEDILSIYSDLREKLNYQFEELLKEGKTRTKDYQDEKDEQKRLDKTLVKDIKEIDKEMKKINKDLLIKRQKI